MRKALSRGSEGAVNGRGRSREATTSAVQNLALTENAKSRILSSMSIVSELHDINRRLQLLEKLALELRGYL